MQIKIRKAKIKDMPEIVYLALDLLKYHQKIDSYFTPHKNAHLTYEDFFRRCMYSSKKNLLVAEINNEIIGYALGEIKLRPPVFKIRQIGHINDCFVSQKFRRVGIAKLFLKELFGWFKNKHVKFIELNVHLKNRAGIKAWSKCGFADFMNRRRIKI